jgi:hypothetical protein
MAAPRMNPSLARLLFVAAMMWAGVSPEARADLATPLTLENLDPDAFTQWVDGAEKPVLDEHGKMRPPESAVWTTTYHFIWPSLTYGDSKAPGVRYLRVGFRNPIAVGSVLARGGGKLSVLKPEAAYPGNPNDDSQWIPAERLKDGRVCADEAGADDDALWVLPSVVTTRALRFTHVAQPIDHVYGGIFNGAYVLSQRVANLAPQAVVTASSNGPHASRLNDEQDNGWGAWDNLTAIEGQRPRALAEDPEWIMMTWPAPVRVDGLALLGVGFADADVQIYTGPANRHPGLATEDEWKSVKALAGLRNFYPGILPAQFFGLDRAVTTRAVRLRLTRALEEKPLHPHLQGKTNGGKRVWLDEIMALKTLDGDGLATAVLPVAAQDTRAPIPLKFTLPEDGLVTLVIEDAKGKRVRNLIAETPFPKGENTVYWDGTDDIGRDPDAASHGLYSIPARIVAPGGYTVRGLWHRPIDLRYEMSIYSPGNPPWPTQDHTGGWMTNHTPASAALFLPAARASDGIARMLLGSFVGEGGSAFSWLDLDGNKQGGRVWIGGDWTGAQYLACDNGANRVPGADVYVGSAWKLEAKPGEKARGVIRLTALKAPAFADEKPLLNPVYTFDFPPGNPDPYVAMGGLAVHDGLLVFSQTTLDRLVFVDAKSGQVLGTSPLPHPRGLAFDGQGRLLVLSGPSLLRFTLRNPPLPLPLPAPETVVDHLDEPAGLTTDATGNISISLQGKSNQVETFSPDGKLLASYGKPGPSQAGLYDAQHMNNPKGIAVDGNGRLWVAEDCYQPKRISVWAPDGSLWKAFYGPAQYGGGGALDSRDATRFSYDGMEFHVDWAKGDATLQRIYDRTETDPLKSIFGYAPPEWALHFNGRRYLTDAFNSSPTNGASIATLYLDRGDTVVPVAALGSANEWDLLKSEAFRPLWPAGIDLAGNRWSNQAMFVWSDLNGDGQVEPDEVQMWAEGSGGVTVADDGSFVVNNVHAGPAVGGIERFRPEKFTPEGAPVYSRKMEVLGDAQGPASSGGDQALVGTDGWTIVTNAPPPYSNCGLGGVRDRVALWSYPSLWPGLHASHNSPVPDRPGELIGTTRLLGGMVTPKNSDAGPLFFINSNQGDIYVFTQDGLFVAQLFQDSRQGQGWEMPQAQRGMLVTRLTLHDENFFPTVAQVPDGSTYIDTGSLSALVKVEGLESIRRIAPVPFTLTTDDLKRAADFATQREAARQSAQGTGVLKVPLLPNAPALDANADAWTDAAWALIDQRGVAAYFNSNSKPYDVQAAVSVADGKLFALWKTGNPSLLKNSGEIADAPFKTGGALDLMIGTDPNADPHRVQPVAGDLRLLVTEVDHKTRAVLYRAVVPGTPDAQKVPFSAPWHSITLDSVIDVSDQVQLAQDGKGAYEIAVPLSTLRLDPRDGMKISADIGILRGDGNQTTQRVYWNNKATALVSDVPSEAMLTPGLWGVWEFHSR